jgi:hypothetical protein
VANSSASGRVWRARSALLRCDQGHRDSEAGRPIFKQNLWHLPPAGSPLRKRQQALLQLARRHFDEIYNKWFVAGD